MILKNIYLKRLAQITFIGLFLFFISRHFLSHGDELHIITRVHIANLAVLALLVIGLNICYAYKLFLILRKLGLAELGKLDWLRIFWISRFFNLYITQGGNIYRSIELKREYNFPYTKSISLMTFFTWLETITFFCLAFLLIVVLAPQTTIRAFSVPGFIFIATVIIIILPFLAHRWINRSSSRNTYLKWVWQKLCDLTGYFKASMTDGYLMLKITILNIISFFIHVGLIWNCFQALDIHISLIETILFAIVIRLTTIVMIVPGNVGLVEWFGGLFTNLLGLPLGSGIIATALGRIVEFFVINFFGVIFLNPFSKRKKNINK
ncbi:MAG: lysylphosphatidylglycerol synthase transmembrane domain-containing protein [Candidatus Omnitrophota bacterium]